jgi:predicted Fe-Mo cluster-binding NifX family protein
MELIVAFSTHDGENLVTDDHAGQARYFDLYRLSGNGAEFVERRENSKYGGDEALRHGDPEKAKKSLNALDGVHAWANPRFGPNLPRLLKKLVCVVVRVEKVSDAVDLVSQHFDEVVKQHEAGEERSHVVLKPQ